MSFPTTVFIDTNIFDSHSFDFHDGDLFRLKQLVKENKFRIILSDIVIREAKKHIVRNISDVQAVLKKALKTHLNKQGYESWCTGLQATKIIRQIDQFSLIHDIVDESVKIKLIESALLEFDKYIQEIRATIFDSSDIDINSIIADYFENRPPFMSKKDKKSEFPDAFMISKINKLANGFDELHVVSDDKAFKHLELNSKIKVYRSLKDLLSFLFPYENWVIPVTGFINDSENQTKIIELIIDKIYYENPMVDGQDYDRKGIVEGFDYDETEIESVNDVTVNFASIDAVNDNDIIVSLTCTATITASCTYFDDSNSSWDSEEHDYIFRNYGHTTEIHQIEFDGVIKILYEGDELIEIDGLSFEVQLDQNSRVSREIISERDYDYKDIIENELEVDNLPF